jgi:hypothetical protein
MAGIVVAIAGTAGGGGDLEVVGALLPAVNADLEHVIVARLNLNPMIKHLNQRIR